MCLASHQFRLGAAFAVVMLALGKSASAQTFTWNVANGSFQNPSSWTPLGGPPGPALGVTGAFTSASPLTQYLATFDSDWAINILAVNQCNTTFALNGHTFTINNPSFGTTASQTTTMNWSGGTVLSPGAYAYATATNSVFNLNLDHTNFSASNYTDFAVGTGSTVTVNIRNGSSYSAVGPSYIGDVGTATVNVIGTGASLSLGVGSRIGATNSGVGNVSVQNGAAFQTVGSLLMANSSGSNASVTIAGPGSTWTHTDGFITTGSGVSPTININAGATLTVTGFGTAAGISLNSNSSMNVSGTVNISGVGQSGINLNAGILTISTGGSITTDYFTRTTGSSLGLNDGSLIVNKQFNWNTAPLNISGISGGNPVVQLQNGATTSGLAGVTLGATLGQRGTFRVLSGSTATFSGLAAIGNQGPGTLLIDGPGSTLTSTQAGGPAVQIGQSAVGTMTVQNGGTYIGGANLSIALGTASGGNGTLTVTGAGSSVSTGGMAIGQGGTGTVNILNGGALLTVGGINIGENAAGSGTLNVSGSGSSLNDGFSLFIGGTSAASANNGSQFNITNGGSATAAQLPGSLCTLWNGSSLTISGGGSFTVGGFTRLGTLNLNNGTLTTTSFFSNGDSATPLTIQGLNPTDVATLQLTGSTSNNISSLTIGGTRTGVVNVTNGAILNASSVSFASSSLGNGTLSLSGNGSTLNDSGPMTFGSSGVGTLTIGAGSTANVDGAVTLGTSGTINLNGGQINLGGLTLNGGVFNWSSGTVAFNSTQTLGSSQLSALLGPNGTVTAARTLRGSNIAGNSLFLSGNLTVNGGLVSAAEVNNSAALVVNSGTVQGTVQVTNNLGGLITLASGGLISGSLANGGEIQFGGGAARLVGDASNTGRMTGSGTISGNLNNLSSGRVIVDAGQRLVFGGAASNNNANGSIEMTGGTIEFAGQLTNAANGLISGRGIFRGSSGNVSGTGLVNNGAVAFSGGFSDVFGKVTNTGGGQIVTAGGGTTTFHDDMIHNGAEIRTASGSRTVFFGAASGAGPYTGTGTVEFQGDLRPGNSPAIVTAAGDVVFGNSARFHLEIGGPTPGFGSANHDQMLITGATALDGSLSIEMINGYSPAIGTVIDFMHFGNRTGDFAHFIGLNLGNGTMWQPQLGAGFYHLTLVPVPEPTLILGTCALSLGAVGFVRRRRCERHRQRSVERSAATGRIV